MKRNRLRLSLEAAILGGALLLVCSPANVTAISIWVDEYGNATTDGSTPISSSILSQGALSFDETTSTGSVMKYHTGLNYNIVGGVVFIYDDAAHTQLSDVISFFEDGVGYLQFYSGASSVPAYCYSLLSEGYGVSLTEGANGLTTYTPGSDAVGAYLNITAGGYTPGPSVTYTFVSDETTVPDGGATIGLFALGLLGMSAFWRKMAP